MKKSILNLTFLLISLNTAMSQQISSRLDEYLVTESTNKSANFISILIQLDDKVNFKNYQNDNLSERTKPVLQALKYNATLSQQASY